MLATSTLDLVATLRPAVRAIAREAGALALSSFRLGAADRGPALAQGQGLARHRGGCRGRHLPEDPPVADPPGGRLALRGDRRQPGAPRPAPRLDRRPDRRHPGLRGGRPGLVGRDRAPRRRPAGDRDRAMRRPTTGSTRPGSAPARGRTASRSASPPARRSRAPASPARSPSSTPSSGGRAGPWSGIRRSPRWRCASRGSRTARSMSASCRATPATGISPPPT